MTSTLSSVRFTPKSGHMFCKLRMGRTFTVHSITSSAQKKLRAQVHGGMRVVINF